jgi:2,3-dihydroxybenzoate-AMP ligase
VAVVDDKESVTYAELGRRSEHVACSLIDLGIRPRDRVVVQLPNTISFVTLYFGLQQIGAIPIMAPPSHRFREVEQFVRLSGAVALATPATAKDADFGDIFARVAAQHPGLRLHLVLDSQANPDSVAAQDAAGPIRIETLHRGPVIASSAAVETMCSSIDPEDPAVFQLSGGTTGIPKLIPRSHNDYAFNSRLAVSVCDVRAGDVLLNPLPISHNLPLACPGVQGFLLSGATVALTRSTQAASLFERIDRLKATHMHVVPSLLIKLINDPSAGSHDLLSMRVIQSGGQRLQPETRQRAARIFPRATVQENFGMAEGLLMFVRLDDPPEVRLQTVGRAVCPDDEVRLVDSAGRDVADGEVGELWTRGPYTLRGYYNADEHNARAFSSDGFYMSGDLLWRHPSGNYVVAGRQKDLINRGGEKISAEEVENLILAHPAISNVACVPVPDELLRERMCACVTLRDGISSITLEELISHLQQFELAKHKLPEYLRVYDTLPLSPVGKVSKKDLVAGLAGRST